MAVFRPKRNGIQSKNYVCEFVIHSKRIQESTGASSKTVAKEYEKRRRAELERAAAGLPTGEKVPRLKVVNEVSDGYLDGYRTTHKPKSVIFAEGCLKNVKRHLGTVLLPDLTEERIRKYITLRKTERASGRTITMEVGELSRALGRTWRELWPRIKKLEERKDVGRALSPEEQHRLLDELAKTRSSITKTLVPLLLLTGMRSGEAKQLKWVQIDLNNRLITVGRAKTSSGTGRVIPINDELAAILAHHRSWFATQFGEAQPDFYLFPWGSPEPIDPLRHVTDFKTGWKELRKRAGIDCRLHDLRHSFATGLAEGGTSESTMLALMGHMSRSMLERYSHIRMAAKVEAVSGIKLRPTITFSNPLPVKLPVAGQYRPM
ncbi:MAG: tyrosine-type recombinase/integrase [Bryobacteraceae bacterium]